jgi:formylglycine-generating enzyme required for sulfatase activity
MGIAADYQNKHKDEMPQRQVYIDKPFWIGATEVTQFQYEEIMWNNPSLFRKYGHSAPVEKVSWYDAMEFCRRMTFREKTAGRLLNGYVYRLPTEAEWEYSCRAGSNDIFFFGKNVNMLEEYVWFRTNADRMAQTVGGKRPNQWGLYDMLGNVWEWTLKPEIRKGNSLYDKSAKKYYILRGGSWANLPQLLRNTSRMKIDSPMYSDATIGFRVVLAPKAEPEKKSIFGKKTNIEDEDDL